MSSRSGLSLFELLIALALLALIAVGLSGSLNFSVSVYDRAQVDPIKSGQVALKARLRSWLVNAKPPSGIAPYPIAFVGEPTRLEFTTSHTKGFANKAAALNVLIEAESSNLVVTISEVDDEGKTHRVHEATIAESIDAVFSYYDAQKDQPGWDETWSNPSRLPDLVRIEGAMDSISSWLTFVVRPLLN